MKIGIVGAGGMAKALAGKWRRSHQVMLSGRDPEKTKQAAETVGAAAGTAAEATAFGDVVVLATRWQDVFSGIESAGGPEAFSGKVVIDINNPVDIETFRTTRTDGRSLTEAIADALPGAHVGKAFNMAQVAVWEDPDMTYDGRQMVVLFTADDGAADVIARLISDVGAEPLKLGGNAHAYQLEAAAAIVIKFLFAGRDPKTIFNFIQPEVKTGQLMPCRKVLGEMQSVKGKTVAVVGAGSGIGKAIAQAVDTAGGTVVLSSRTKSRLEAVANSIGGASVLPVDMTDMASVRHWAANLPAIDHLVISASSAAHGAFAVLDETALRAMFDAKFFGPYRIAKEALGKINAGGSITFFSGVLSRRPGMNCSGLGAVNGAIESLCYGLALELGPGIRVNCVSPGMVRSEAYDGLDERAREDMYAATGASLPLGRVGTVEEAALAAIYLMTNTYSTGTVLDVDGGHMIRQYAKR